VTPSWDPPEELALKAFADGHPFPGALFLARVPTTKNPLALLPLGPSDERGEARVGRAALDALYREAGRDSIMDYGAPLGELVVRVANRDDLANLHRGYETWSQALTYPDGYLDLLAAAEDALRFWAGQTLRAVVAGRGGSLKLTGSVQKA
jgi:hypothetical protein